jgi:valyl-tRNA synthetase
VGPQLQGPLQPLLDDAWQEAALPERLRLQGLWIEVEVEKELGFKSKRDIEAFGVAEFVEACKERVRRFAAIQTDQSIRMGYWMDWTTATSRTQTRTTTRSGRF